jgi:GNAT superfamily N-acetyltransferase
VREITERFTDPIADPLGASALDAIAALCSRAVADPPTRDELEAALTSPDQPARLRGDPDVGVVAVVTTGDQGFVRLLAVAPEHRRQGIGRALLAAGEADLRAAGALTVTVGADAPYYLWPGVDTREIGLLCLLERAKYARGEANCNMDVDLARIPADPGGWTRAAPPDAAELEAWSARHWDHWRPEIVRAATRGTLVLTRDDAGIAAICAYDVTRRGLVGPVAARPDLLRRGRGVAPLLGALHTMRGEGRDRAEISWVGPLVPYARVGATVGRVFFVHRKTLR